MVINIYVYNYIYIYIYIFNICGHWLLLSVYKFIWVCLKIAYTPSNGKMRIIFAVAH